MRILVDSDSLNVRVREIITGAAARHGIEAVFVANRPLPVPSVRHKRGADDADSSARDEAVVSMIVAEDADDWLVDAAEEGDLAITRDVPLAARLVPRGVEVISDRGEHYTKENIGRRGSERDFAMQLRATGAISERGRPYGRREIAAFANLLDRELTVRSRQGRNAGETVDRGEGNC